MQHGQSHHTAFDMVGISVSTSFEAGIPVKVVSERLGHSTTSITADIYQHVAPHMQEAAANKLGAMLLGDPEPKAEG